MSTGPPRRYAGDLAGSPKVPAALETMATLGSAETQTTGRCDRLRQTVAVIGGRREPDGLVHGDACVQAASPRTPG